MSIVTGGYGSGAIKLADVGWLKTVFHGTFKHDRDDLAFKHDKLQHQFKTVEADIKFGINTIEIPFTTQYHDVKFKSCKLDC